MKNPKSFSIGFALVLVAGLAASTISVQAQSASATIFGVPSAGSYDYTITLKNTGSTVLESFWYGWTTSGNNLPANPSNAGNSLGWANNLNGNSIEYIGSSQPLNPNQSATFTFTSTSTPAQITTIPSGESVAYVGGITFTQGNPGDSTDVFSPILIAVPEPSTASFVVLGLIGLLATGWRRLRAARPPCPQKNFQL